MIIDVHTHLTQDFEQFGRYISLEESIERMDRFGIEVCCTFNTAGITGDWEESNKGIYDAVCKYPKRLIGFTSFNPYFTQDIAGRLKHCVEDYGFRGVKLKDTLTGIRYDDTRYYPIYEEALKCNLPIIVHGSSDGGGRSLKKPASDFPDLIFIMGHAGGIHWQEASAVARDYPNIYLEINYSVIENGMIEYMVNNAGADKVLFGTDIPYSDPSTSVGKVKYADITEEDRANIYYGNAARILGLDVGEDRR